MEVSRARGTGRLAAPRTVRRHARSGIRDVRAMDSGARSRTFARSIRSRRRIRTGSTDRSSAPRRSTRCAACCRRRHSPTSVCSAPVRRTNRCCCGCSRIRCRRSATTRALMLAELRQIIPAFLTRVDQPNRGGRGIRVPVRHAPRPSSCWPIRSSAASSAERPAGGDAHRFRSGGRDEGGRRRPLRRVGAARRPAHGDRPSVCRPTIGSRCFAPTSGSARTVVTGRAARSSAPPTGSTC